MRPSLPAHASVLPPATGSSCLGATPQAAAVPLLVLAHCIPSLAATAASLLQPPPASCVMQGSVAELQAWVDRQTGGSLVAYYFGIATEGQSDLIKLLSNQLPGTLLAAAVSCRGVLLSCREGSRWLSSTLTWNCI